jgi:nicotinate-nucleotide adenylyltransferase
VIGDDNLEDLHKWKGYPAHFDYADFIVLPRRRPGDLEKRLADHPYADRLHPLAAETVKISSTEIRRRIAAGKAVDGLVPEAVHAYIQEHGLYR